MILAHATQAEIAEELGVERQAVNRLVIGEGWEQICRKNVIPRKSKLQCLTFLLYSHCLSRAEQEGLNTPVNYFFQRGYGLKRKEIPVRGEGVSLENLIKLVELTRFLKERGIRLSYKELGKAVGLGVAATVGNISRDLGLDYLYWKPHRKEYKVSQVKVEAIERAIHLGYLSDRDISYFLDVHVHFVGTIKNRLPKNKLKQKYIKIGKHGLSYREASQIYGFKDEFNAPDPEIADAIGKPLFVVDYAIKKRHKLEPKILNALKVIFPEQDIQKPYI